MVWVELHERWKLTPADVLSVVATLRERTAGFQVCDVRRQSRDLVELALFGGWVGY